MNLDSLKPAWWPGRKKEEKKGVDFDNRAPDNLPVDEIPKNDIWSATDKERVLIKKRKELMNQHRHHTRNLESLKINRTNKEGKRSETYKEYLGSLEKELLEVSKEINQLRDKFDKQPGREYVLKERLERLGEIRKILDRQFSKSSETGEQYEKYINERDALKKQLENKKKELRDGGDREPELHPNYTYLRDQVDEKMKEIVDNFERNIRPTKEFKNYERKRDKIIELTTDTEWMLRNARRDEYDENGFNEVERK